MIGDLQGLVVALVVVLLTCVIGLGIAQTSVDTVGFTASDDFCATKDTVVTSIGGAFDWLPMLMLLAIGAIAIMYVARFVGWI